MKQLIAICGLDCEQCDAYIATKNDDQALREQTARLWSELNQAPILPEHINCEGCRTNGAKTLFCSSFARFGSAQWPKVSKPVANVRKKKPARRLALSGGTIPRQRQT